MADLKNRQVHCQVALDEGAGVARPTLVDFQSILVGDDGPHPVHRVAIGHVEAENQRRRHDAPQAEMGALLVGALGLGTIEVPDLHHVRVRPAARPGQRVRAVVVRQRGVSLSQDAPEVSRDVAAGTVHVHRAEAGLGIRRTVVAVFDPHSLPALVEELSESRHVDRISTAVNLDTVETHGEEPSDVLLVVGRGLVLHADAGIQIASNLQAQGMPVLDQAVHVGEAMQVDHRQASHLIVPRALSPNALVNRALGQRRI
mmetsp:Transcript_156477/g.502105  ORF Transcript_156477/g.502105 Transcript_156477/m.502105 type:complete len:258 (+) Transcript_156477:774-1547(+)